jgi:ferredoxin
MIRHYKGSHSGEHGDGLLRSEFHAAMLGAHIVRSFEEIKDAFDPSGLFNPDRIVHAPKFDDRTLFRYGPNYEPIDHPVRLDWSSYSGKSGGFQGAVEMCNNNGLCRKLEGGTMSPSYRVTRSEKDVTRGRANTLRLALSGQLGADALTSDDILGAMELCVSCKACRKECPTGVDMARMKIEVFAARADRYGISIRDRLIGWMPRYAPYAASFPWLLNLRDRLPGLAELSEKLVGSALIEGYRVGAETYSAIIPILMELRAAQRLYFS